MIKNTQTAAQLTPPSLISSLLAGFDAAASHLWLIVFPLLLDLFLWFGPRLRMEEIIRSMVRQMGALPEASAPEMSEVVKLSQELWLLLAERANIFYALRSFPIGVPSLLVSKQPLANPLGAPGGWEASSLLAVVGAWLLITTAGLTFGALYFQLVAQATGNEKVEWRQAVSGWPRAAWQAMQLSLFTFAILAAVAIPASCFLSVMALGGIGLMQISTFVLLGLVVWVFSPLLLSPHGIFVFQHKMWASVRQSINVSRLTFMRTSALFLLILVLSEGLNALWRTPAEDSWLTLLGVAGHAFVTTGLLAASFVYYRDASRWVQRV
ncbi:MAG: hypothetical protein L0Z70_01805, partial [Chloroflexi bacterium]|nr:hypothetical protein [Chloroflexota bacterium]